MSSTQYSKERKKTAIQEGVAAANKAAASIRSRSSTGNTTNTTNTGCGTGGSTNEGGGWGSTTQAGGVNQPSTSSYGGAESGNAPKGAGFTVNHGEGTMWVKGQPDPDRFKETGRVTATGKPIYRDSFAA